LPEDYQNLLRFQINAPAYYKKDEGKEDEAVGKDNDK
jgi:hypothetical protein